MSQGNAADRKGGVNMNPDELAVEEQFCTWTEEDEGAYWSTGCGEEFTIIFGTPSQNRMNYCTFCGKLIMEVEKIEEEDHE